jgi:monomeric isocitrate dehydrogenase
MTMNSIPAVTKVSRLDTVYRKLTMNDGSIVMIHGELNNETSKWQLTSVYTAENEEQAQDRSKLKHVFDSLRPMLDSDASEWDDDVPEWMPAMCLDFIPK